MNLEREFERELGDYNFFAQYEVAQRLLQEEEWAVELENELFDDDYEKCL